MGSSLQAKLQLTLKQTDYDLLSSLGDNLKFVFITSIASIEVGSTEQILVSVMSADKCARCWHYAEDVGANPTYATLCSRCVSNLFGQGEKRLFA